LNDQEVLRIYHDGFEDYPKGRNIYQEIELTQGKAIFKEHWIDSLNELIVFDTQTSGFLDLNHVKNPYETYCCDYQEFITYEKDFLKNNEIANVSQFKELSEFVKKWSGYNLEKSPYSYNNILTFKPKKIEIELTKSQENQQKLNLEILHNKYGETLTCIIKFKYNHIVVDTKVVPITRCLVSIESQNVWDSIDLELYSKEHLVHAEYDISFIQSVHINVGTISREVKVALGKSDKMVTLEHVIFQPINVEEYKKPKELTAYHSEEQLLTQQLNPERRFNFLSKGQYEQGLDIFSDIAGTHGFDEMWVFDPYFITFDTVGGKARLNDIIKVLGKNLGLKKNIVFEAKQEEVNTKFIKFKEAIQGTVDFLKKRDINLDFTFLGTSEHFHDRFIFLKNRSLLKAYLLGTSFNSFGDNYSTIVELESLDGKMIFKTLMDDIMGQQHIILTEKLK